MKGPEVGERRGQWERKLVDIDSQIICRRRRKEMAGGQGNWFSLWVPARYCFHDCSCLASYFRLQLTRALVRIPSAHTCELVERCSGVCGAPEGIPSGITGFSVDSPQNQV